MIDTMMNVTTKQNPFLALFEQFETETARKDPPFLRRIRSTAIARFAELGLPTTRNEDWKFTNVAAIAKTSFQSSASSDRVDLNPQDIARLTFSDNDCLRLVFINGRFTAGLSRIQGMPTGAFVGSLAVALIEHRDKIEPHLSRYAKFDESAFTALNTAFIQDGAFLFVPKGKVERPIHLVFLTTQVSGPTACHPRNLIIVGNQAQVELVESYVALDAEGYFTNAVTEILVGENAIVDHCKLQREETDAFHVAHTTVHQARSSKFSSHYVGLGGSLVRNETRVVLDAEGCESTVNGLYLARGRQHMDNLTVIDHAKPHCASHELYKGILADQAHGVFNGKIFVRQDAQKTDAKQTNQTLLLSEDAVINTKPQLEIFADDVKCTHGATVGQLNEESLFYLRARGIGLEEAKRLLTFAFANDVIGKITVPALRERLERTLLEMPLLTGEPTAKEDA